MNNTRIESHRHLIKLIITAFTIIFCCNILYSADSGSAIIVYGNEKCGYCGETMQWLEKQGIPYIYRDVELYGTNQEEMFAKLEKAGFTSTAYFPVLDIKGQILMKPKFEDIKKAYSGEVIRINGEKKFRNPLWRPVKNKSLKKDFASLKSVLKEADIIIYDDGSGSGKALLSQMKKEQIPFTLKQLNKLNNAAYFNMSSRLAGLGYGNVTLFPVIEVRGEMIMRPSIDDVKVLIIEMISD